MNHSDIARGEEAYRLLESKIFKEAVQEVESEIVRRWRVSEDIQEREGLYHEQKVLARVVGALKEVADNGRLAADRLNRTERNKNG